MNRAARLRRPYRARRARNGTRVAGTTARQLLRSASEVHMFGSHPRAGSFALAGALTVAVSGFAAPSAMASSAGALYTQTNDPAGNVVQMFDRDAAGSLSAGRSYATGGAGL